MALDPCRRRHSELAPVPKPALVALRLDQGALGFGSSIYTQLETWPGGTDADVRARLLIVAIGGMAFRDLSGGSPLADERAAGADLRGLDRPAVVDLDRSEGSGKALIDLAAGSRPPLPDAKRPQAEPEGASFGGRSRRIRVGHPTASAPSATGLCVVRLRAPSSFRPNRARTATTMGKANAMQKAVRSHPAAIRTPAR